MESIINHPLSIIAMCIIGYKILVIIYKTMKTKKLILLAIMATLSMCSSPKKTLPVPTRERCTVLHLNERGEEVECPDTLK